MFLNGYFTLNSGWLSHVKVFARKRIFPAYESLVHSGDYSRRSRRFRRL